MSLSQLDSDGSRLASLGADGVLSVWSQVQGNIPVLGQKLVTSSHLSAAPSCLLWSVGRGGDKDLIAMGTESGDVQVYSTSQSRIVHTKKVSGKVLSLCWGQDNSLYIGTEAGSVHILRLGEGEDEMVSDPSLHNPVHCLAVHGGTLAIASRNIVLWDLKSKTSKTLSGHSSPVTSLHFDASGTLLFSSSNYERVVSVWNCVKKKKRTVTVANLVVNDNIREVDVSQDEGESLARVSVISSLGKLLVFKLDTDNCNGTVQPVASVMINSPEGENLPIINSRIIKNTDLVSVHYRPGSGLPTPQMEQLSLPDLQLGSGLVREVRRGRAQAQTGDQEVVTPRTDGKVVFLAPGPSLGATPTNSRKRHAQKQNENSLPVEERLSLLSTTTTGSSSSPRTDTLTQLLVQGLHSNDARILDSVLDRADLTLIDNTVKRLPAEAVLPLVTILQKYIRGRGVVHASHAKWLKSVLSIHQGFLVCVPECQDILAPVYALLEARTQNYFQVLQLRGKLDMMMKKNDDKQPDNNLDIEQEALAVYQDTSSDESDDMMSDLMINDNDQDEEDEDEIEESEDNDEEMLSESD